MRNGKDRWFRKLLGFFGEKGPDKKDRSDSNRSPWEEEDSSSYSSIPLGIWSPHQVVADIYRVVGVIGRGGMGVVYLLNEWGTDRLAAAKMPAGEFIYDGSARKRFTQEAEAWTELAAHPNIVRAYDVREVDYIPCIFMEYVDGGSVDELLMNHQNGFPFEEAFKIALQTCWAMAFAHKKGHIHRDLKPANLLITADGTVKVTDFGLVKSVALNEAALKEVLDSINIPFDENPAAGMVSRDVAGTWPYMAPEQWEGKAVPAVDIYAFGITLCELFCGRRPLDLKTHPKYRQRNIYTDMQGYFYKYLHQNGEPEDPAEIRRDLPGDVRDIILKCLAKSPGKRFPDFDSVADALLIAYEKFTNGMEFPLKKPGKVELNNQQKNDRAWALIRLGMGCKSRSDLNEAMGLYGKSEKLFQELNDRYGLSACYTNMALIQKARGDYDGAMDMHKKSLEIDEELGDRAGMSRCYTNMGLILDARGDYDGAMMMHKKSLEIKEALDDLEGISNCYINIGLILDVRNNYDGAMEMYKKSLEIKKDLGDLAGMSICFSNMGNILKARSNYDSAMLMHKKSLEIREALGNRAGMSNCYTNMGAILKARGDYDGAMDMYKKSLEISESLGSRVGMSNCYTNMGLILKIRGDYNGAMEMHKKSLEIDEALGDRAGMSICYLNMGLVFEKLNERAKALDMYKRSLAVKHELGLPVPKWVPGAIKKLGG